MSGFDPVNYNDKDVLFEAGDKAEKFYVIKSGKVRVFSRAQAKEFAVLNEGESFGEQSLLSGGVRGATAEAVGKTVCLEITASGLRSLLEKEGGLAKSVLEALLLQLSMHNSIRN